MRKFLSIFYILPTVAIAFSNPDWSQLATLPEEGHRENIYSWSKGEFPGVVKRGYLHALTYPVSVTGILIPYKPLQEFLKSNPKNPLKKFILKKIGKKFNFRTMDGLYQWLGLNDYPDEAEEGLFRIPFPNQVRPDYPMGVTLMKNDQGVEGLTFSCAACHTGKFLGRLVMGLTNKTVRANNLFVLAKKYLPMVPTWIFQVGTGASHEEGRMFKRTRQNLRSVGAKDPKVLGLDTSLAQVALSLAHRNKDDYATKNKKYERWPRDNKLRTFVADSKPGVWWNLKYKTKWLLDGSIVSGNPVFTNFLWNELGRGTNLKDLESWMQENQQTIKELTSAVFATKAPNWLDFFDESTISIGRAKRGEKIFQVSCKKCHGTYEKGWSSSNSDFASFKELVKTTKVSYPKRTVVKNVGTDPNRFLGMNYFADDLNKLAISKWMKTKVVPQEGYVPPPLVGIFMRYPYFHNNSIPNLCALFSPPNERPKVFYQGPSEKDSDFDSVCVGYPVGENIPSRWKEIDGARYETQKTGRSNLGHYKMFLDENGYEKYSLEEKLDLIEYLKTL